jgi:putative metalloenzyme radical SAM/SPASM domain maturase
MAGQLHPSRRPGPSKLFVEVTSRCNIACTMCVKQSTYCGIVDGDMKLSTFESLFPVLPEIDSLVLNGIGEPLLHPDLEQFVSEARVRMPSDGLISFQTNGLLLTDIRMHDLVQAGLDRISFSVDAMEPNLLQQVRTGAELKGIEEALKISSRYKAAVPGRPLEIGIEYVLQKDNLENLPATLRWAAARGADFALVTHMLAYDECMKGQSVFDRNTDEAIALYQEWSRKAETEGLNLGEYYDVLWKYVKTGGEQKLVDFVGRMVQDASGKDIFFNLKNLLERDEQIYMRLKSIFEEAGIAAGETGLDLSLPALSPRFDRRCEFIEEGGAFVSWDGYIHPCYFLCC